MWWFDDFVFVLTVEVQELDVEGEIWGEINNIVALWSYVEIGDAAFYLWSFDVA